MTTTVGIAKLKNNLSYYLKQLKQGHRVMVTEHGEIVLELVARLPKSQKLSVEEKLTALADKGVIDYDPERRKRKFTNNKPIKIPGENTMSRWLIEEGRKD